MHHSRQHTERSKRRILSWNWILLLAFLFQQASATAQISPDLGQLPIKNYVSKDYKASPQNWAITQDKDGILYFGNTEGVLCFDGRSWSLIKSSNESVVRSLDVSPGGTVYVGAVGDFGYLSADASGKKVYVSLQRRFNLKSEDIEDVFHVHAFDEGVYFMTNRSIFFYDGKSLRVWESESLFQSAYDVNGKYIVNQLSNGLCEIDGDSLVPLSKANDFKGIRIYDIIPYSEEDMLVLTEKMGIYEFYRNRKNSGRNRSYLVKMNAGTQEFNPNNGIFINNGILSIGTWGHGLLMVDERGDIVQQVNTDYGLNDEVINDQYLDKEGNLWVAMSNGISMITLNKGVVGFADKANVNETVEAITEFDGKVYIATHTGLYYMDSDTKSGEFTKVPGIDKECWGILPFRYGDYECLLIGENNAIYVLEKDQNLQKLKVCYPWTFHLFEEDPSFVFVGLDDGLLFLRFVRGKWEVSEKVPGIENSVYSIAEARPNELWLGSPNVATRVRLEWMKSTGAFRFKIEDFSSDVNLPDGDVVLEMMGEDFLIGTSKGIYSFDREKGEFYPNEKFTEAFGSRNYQAHRLKYQEGGRLWMSAYHKSQFYLGYFDVNGEEVNWVERDFLPFANEVYHAFYSRDDSETWFGGPNGLLKYSGHLNPELSMVDYQVLIRSVTLNNDSVHFMGNRSSVDYGDSLNKGMSRVILPYQFNSICFEFASQFHKYADNNQYSYRLEGFTNNWSDWTSEPKAVFTNLYEGYYKFQVKARNVYGQESEISTYSFRIAPPWYRAWWAYFVYAILAVVLIYVIVAVYTRNLKEIIRDKTAEVVAQKDEIEKQKNEVEKQRFELEMKNADITSSINYAQRLQRAILPEDRTIKEYFEDAFILYRPKDIVSGDFYWLEHVNGATGRNVTLFAAVDCTGHGVPGAFVSVVGNSGLNRAVNEFGLIQPASILEKLNEIVVETLSKGDTEVRDGMDISLCSFDFERMEMEFAGANNSAYLVRRNVASMDLGLNGTARYHKRDLIEIKANKQPVGFYEFKKDFVNNKIQIQKGDVIYLFSDGFADQFGGPRGKKYNYPRFKDFLTSISHKPMDEQKQLIEHEFETWKGKEDQVDDVVIAGIRV